MRIPWSAGFPPVFARAAWDGTGALRDHPSYWRAKKRRDAEAALRVCGDLGREEVLENLYDLSVATGEPVPVVAAPAMTPDESQNYLAIGYARWLSHELGWEVSRDIFQAKTLSRDFSTDGWFRLAHDPEFYGLVHEGRRYVLADDVCTMGGTLASLRGFIESKGGRVIGVTVLANYDGRHVPISLADSTRNGLFIRLGEDFRSACAEELSYAPECLTEAEGRFLLRCPSVDAFRAGLDGARDCGGARDVRRASARQEASIPPSAE
jgi:hypothetical protein